MNALIKLSMITASFVIVIGCSAQPKKDTPIDAQLMESKYTSVIAKSSWIHGSANCDDNLDAALDVYQHSANTYILRQNKCLTFEAPFIYVLVGSKSILVLDTGALDAGEYSVYNAIETKLGKKLLDSRELIVVHSHGHSDHYKGDNYFTGRANTTVVAPSKKEMMGFFKFENWPKETSTLDLGDRQLTIIPIPGHQEQSIAVYDQHTKWLMTGDTLYPGIVYVKDWDAFRSSIARLAQFASNNNVTAIMGAHIEMRSDPTLAYPIGSTYQPNEAALDLPIEDLTLLNKTLAKTPESEELVFDRFIIKPLNFLQKLISNIAGWFMD